MASIIDFEHYKKERTLAVSPNYTDFVRHAKTLMKMINEHEARETNEAQRSINARTCTLEIAQGELEGEDGYFVRYRKDDVEFCIRFCRKIYKSQAKRCLDNACEFRVPWREITKDKKFEREVILAPYFHYYASGAGKIHLRDCLYYAPDSLDLSVFEPPMRFRNEQ